MAETKSTLLMRFCDYGIERPTLEHRFHPKRKYQFDFCWAKKMIAVELEGGANEDRYTARGERFEVRGRHMRAEGFQADMNKYNSAVALGWRVFRFTTFDVQCYTRNLKESLEAIKRMLRKS
jgi:very-short-patch-repair endonuclease